MQSQATSTGANQAQPELDDTLMETKLSSNAKLKHLYSESSPSPREACTDVVPLTAHEKNGNVAVTMQTNESAFCSPMNRLENLSHSPLLPCSSFSILADPVAKCQVDEQSPCSLLLGGALHPSYAAPGFHHLLPISSCAPSPTSKKNDSLKSQQACGEVIDESKQLLFDVAARHGACFGRHAPPPNLVGVKPHENSDLSIIDQLPHRAAQQGVKMVGREPLQALDMNAITPMAAVVKESPAMQSTGRMSGVREPYDISPLDRKGLPAHDMAHALAYSTESLYSLSTISDDSPCPHSRHMNGKDYQIDDTTFTLPPLGTNSKRLAGCLADALSPLRYSSPPGGIYMHSPSGPRILRKSTIARECPSPMPGMELRIRKRSFCFSPSSNIISTNQENAGKTCEESLPSSVATVEQREAKTVYLGCAPNVELQHSLSDGINKSSKQPDTLYPASDRHSDLQRLASAAVVASDVAGTCQVDSLGILKPDNPVKAHATVPPLIVLPDSSRVADRVRSFVTPPKGCQKDTLGGVHGNNKHARGRRLPLCSVENTLYNSAEDGTSVPRRGKDAYAGLADFHGFEKKKKRGSSRQAKPVMCFDPRQLPNHIPHWLRRWVILKVYNQGNRSNKVMVTDERWEAMAVTAIDRARNIDTTTEHIPWMTEKEVSYFRDWVDKNLDAKVEFTGNRSIQENYESNELLRYTKLADRNNNGGRWLVHVRNQTKLNQMRMAKPQKVCEKILRQDDRLEVIPLSKVEQTIRTHHILENGCHSGILRTYDLIAKHFYGVSREMVEEYVDHCDFCCERASGTKRMPAREAKNIEAEAALKIAEAGLVELAEQHQQQRLHKYEDTVAYM